MNSNENSEPIVTYMTGVNADKTFPVKGVRMPANYLSWTTQREFVLGGVWRDDVKIVAINFYTGFVGCPARYYITFDTGTTIICNA